MKVKGYLGVQRYPKTKGAFSKDGVLNENYIFAFTSTHTLNKEQKEIGSIKIFKPNMALVANGKVCVEYDAIEKNDFGTTISDCAFLYDEVLFQNKRDKDSIIKKLPISAETKNILLSRTDALGDIIRYANPDIYDGKIRINEKEQPIEDVLDNDVLQRLIELVPDAKATDNKNKDIELIKQKLKPVIKNMDKAKKEKIINLMAAIDPEEIYNHTEDLRIQFNTADKIAECMDIKNNDIKRVKAYVTHTVDSVIRQTGNSFMPTYYLKNTVGKVLTNRENAPQDEWIKPDDINNAIDNMKGKELIFDGQNGEKCYTQSMWNMEKLIAEKLASIASTPARKPKEKDLKLDNKLDDIQKSAVKNALENNISIITGGPGTGKTTIISNIIKNTKNMGYQTLLLAPTGKAANRMHETTDHDAHTVDKLIASKLLQEDVIHDHMHIIIDETSMIAVQHLARLLNMLNQRKVNDIKFTFVGDTNQLQSIAPGRVLADLSQTFNTTKLETVYRQGGNSTINKVAKTIIQGRSVQNMIPPSSHFSYDMDIVQLNCPPDHITGWVEQLTNDVIPVLYKNKGETIDPINDIQILTPYAKEGQFLSTANLNNILNGTNDFRVGSKVIQTVNDYDKNVMNGEIGVVTHYDPEVDETEAIMTVKYDNRTVEYFKEDLSEKQITLANAITIHKSQGSEFKVIILPISSNQNYMMNRKMFYTEITRAKELCILVGETHLIDSMMTKQAPERNSELSEKIKAALEVEKEKQNEINKNIESIITDVENDIDKNNIAHTEFN